MSTKSKKFILAKHFLGKPREEDLKLVEETLHALVDGEFLVEMLYLSVDPYMRPYSRRMKEGDSMIGTGVGRIISSKHPDFGVGKTVTGPFGWKTHAISKGYGVNILPDIGDLPASYGLGVLGMTGLSAYFGFLNLCEPKANETVFVNGAAGAVGSIVGQIAKIKGCRVVGCAGSDKKVEYIKSLGFDEAFNYKTIYSLDETIKKTCPKGIDCFFDNVGGKSFDVASNNMNTRGRIALCGAISSYNMEGDTPQGPYIHMNVIMKELKIEGFIVSRFKPKYSMALKELKEWVDTGKLVCNEHIIDGFENTPKAFIGLFDGVNIGKIVVKI